MKAIGVVSPASTPQLARVEAGEDHLRRLGYGVKRAAHALARGPHYLAGSTEDRLADLHAAFSDDEIVAVMATRGGYGSNYLLAGLDLELIANSGKMFCGYSDLTAIQVQLLDRALVQTLHGPMVAADFSRQDGVHLPSFTAALAGEPYTVGSSQGLRILRPGEASGRLHGGCLSILTSLLGTPYAPKTQGHVLFLEDIGAKPYQVDRMLRQMLDAGMLEGVTGIIFGEMLECVSPGAPAGLLEEVILRVLDTVPGPIGFGLRSGHVSRENVTLTLGAQAHFDALSETALHVAGYAKVG